MRAAPGSLLAFAAAAWRYWCRVFPVVRSELRSWRRRAAAISDPEVRPLAVQALAKRANMEGAAAFATFAPGRRRKDVVRATVAFQSAYNHADLLSERPVADAVLRSRALHAALPAALTATAGRSRGADIGGAEGRAHRRCSYLRALVSTCRQSSAALPSYAAVEAPALRAAERVAAFQSFNCGALQGDHVAMELWARAEADARTVGPGSQLHWWELAGAGGSSVGVHVMIAAAAETRVSRREVDAIEAAYHPHVGALHSMLDQLVDVGEDMLTGQRNLVSYYSGPEQAAERIGALARDAMRGASSLSPRRRHRLIVIAMACMYLTAPQARSPQAQEARREALDALGPLSLAAIAIFKLAGRAGGGPLARAGEWVGPLEHMESPGIETRTLQYPLARDARLWQVGRAR